MKKRIMSLALAVCMAASLVITAEAATTAKIYNPEDYGMVATTWTDEETVLPGGIL